MKSSGISSRGTRSANPSPGERAPDRFSLSGRSQIIDGRINAVRRDLVDIRFAGRVFAPHYAAAKPMTVRQDGVLRAARAADSEVLSSVIAGERFDVLEVAGDLAWGISTIDGVVGYVDASRLGALVSPTHVVTAIETTLLASPTGASLARLWMGAQLRIKREAGDFAETTKGYVRRADIAPLDRRAGDPVAIAEAMVGRRFVGGGRSGAGVDATGLIFLAHMLAGIALPRFADLQSSEFGAALPQDQPARRGDLICFAGHVALMVDAERVVDATADHGVAIESLTSIVSQSDFGDVIARRRSAL